MDLSTDLQILCEMKDHLPRKVAPYTYKCQTNTKDELT